MRKCWFLTAAAVSTLSALPSAQAQPHLNPVVDLLAKQQPVFGLYAPANRRVRPGGPALPADSVKSAAQLAADAVAYKNADYIFDGSMEGDFEAALPGFARFTQGMAAAGMLQKGATPKLTHPIFVKTHEIAPDPALATTRIGQQLNLGVTGIVLVSVESPDEVKAGLAAMRFKSQGGTRSDVVGGAPAMWGLSEKAYKEKADVWPLNPNGELVNFTIVESKAGLARIREIAAVPGIGVLFPGAGTLRGVFSPPDAAGQRVFDEKAWEAAIQSVLAACKEFKVACGYPAGAPDIAMRMRQGFSVFVIGWGEQGFKAVDIGRSVAGRK